jgi:hypothetical protein
MHTAFLLLAAAALTGCDKPLLSREDERSPFDRYDVVRNQFSQMRQTNAFGIPKPNLRERLLPKE